MRTKAVLAVCLLLAGACTSVYQKRGTQAPLSRKITVESLKGTDRAARIRQINLEARSIESFEEATIGIIEIDDDGNVNPVQFDAVMDMVTKETADPALIVTFVHGWHHEARVCDRDLACFRRVLQRLKAINSHRNVVGVFIGWRGESSSVRGVNIATIWDRKRVAEHIGRTGLRRVLLALHQRYRDARERELDTTMVSLGHSLGGAMLYSAVKGQLSGNVADIERKAKLGSYRIVRAEGDREEAAKRNKKALRAGFGDLVVLVNPAIEAREYGAFAADLPNERNSGLTTDELIARKLPYDANEAYDSQQLPVLMTIASTADTAVGRIFPAAQILSAIPLLRPYQLQSEGWHGHGRYRPHFTHRLTHPVLAYESSRDPVAPECDCTKQWQPDGVPGSEETVVSRLDLHTTEPQIFGGGLKFELDPQRQGNWDRRSPYLVVSADKGVIQEHSDIFNPVFVRFLTLYIRAIERERAMTAGVQDR